MPKLIEPPPDSAVKPVTDTLHGVAVTDAYRWLEDQESPDTRSWLAQQTKYTRTYLDAIVGRDRVRAEVEDLLRSKEVPSEPWSVGERYYFLRRSQGNDQPQIIARQGLFGDEEVLVDPVPVKRGLLPNLAIVTISPNGRFLAYSVRVRGADSSAIEILDLKQGCVMPDRVSEGECMGIAFASNNSGFYYSRRTRGNDNSSRVEARWHRFGSKDQDDRIVLSAKEPTNAYLGILRSPEADTLGYVLAQSDESRITSLYLSRARFGEPPRLVLEGIKGCFVPFFAGDQLFAYTDYGAPNFRIVSIDPANPQPAYWRDVVAESDDQIQQFATVGDWVFVTRAHGFSTQLMGFKTDATSTEQIAIPPRGSIDLSRASAEDKLFFTYSSISEPATVFCYDIETKELTRWAESKASIDPSTIECEEATYRSKDGTPIKLFLAAKKELLHSGPLPTFLTAYGGFGICVTPRLTAFATFLIEHGFLFAVPAIRGGSEFGRAWHTAAVRAQRQKCFDDFTAAAEWLVAAERSASGRIAIGGGSNAGLLVGVALTQRPDLYRAAVCLGPLLDMTRYHLFDGARRWIEEYGSPENQEEFQALLSYSPYHNVRDGTQYPALLLISGDSDTRCNPMHARKMTARLQAASASGRPVLLQYKGDWGHMPTQPFSAKIDALTDRLAFVCQELGVVIGEGSH
jgi:prolyl oligopeptidase